MSSRYILAIDQGTSATKSLLVDEDGAVVARGACPLTEQYPQPGWVEQDADAIFDSVRQSVTACLASVDAGHAARIAALAFSTQRESLVLWERASGKAISPVISWQDQRTVAMADALRTPHNEALIRERSGLPLDPMFSALKAQWLLDRHDPTRSRSRDRELCLGTIDSWLMSRFSDHHIIEVGNASRTQLLNVHQAAWDPELLALFNVPLEVLPEIVSSVGPFPPAVNLAPVPDGTPVHAVMGDSHAALFAHGAYAPGQVKVTYGTGSSVMGLVASKENLDPGVCLTIAWAIDGPAYAAEGNIRSAGATLRWAANLLGVDVDQLAQLADASSSNGAAIVPGFSGLGAPWWDRNARGVLSGITLDTGRGQLARAAFESVALQVADVVAAMDSSIGTLDCVYVDGGPTRNRSLLQLQANLLQRPVLRATDAELSALGVAHLAGLQAGVWDWQALAQLQRQREPVTPLARPQDMRPLHDSWRDALRRSRLATPGAPATA